MNENKQIKIKMASAIIIVLVVIILIVIISVAIVTNIITTIKRNEIIDSLRTRNEIEKTNNVQTPVVKNSNEISKENTEKIYNNEEKNIVNNIADSPVKIPENVEEKNVTVTQDYEKGAHGSQSPVQIPGKPIIYLYPETTEAISVKLGCPEKITAIYPQYKDGWTVTAKPDGTLIDEQTGKEYYSLYYECKDNKEYIPKFEEGFVISKENIVNFLEEKLAILGLNERESEEFIIYWLPQLQQYEYVYMRFESIKEIEEIMPLYISKTPDTLIRILMEWKGLNEYIEVKEQELTPVTRKGFTVVEWGATEIK